MRWVIGEAERKGVAPLFLPHHWLTATNQPRCVRCGARLEAEDLTRLLPAGKYLQVGACANCHSEVKKLLEGK